MPLIFVCPTQYASQPSKTLVTPEHTSLHSYRVICDASFPDQILLRTSIYNIHNPCICSITQLLDDVYGYFVVVYGHVVDLRLKIYALYWNSYADEIYSGIAMAEYSQW